MAIIGDSYSSPKLSITYPFSFTLLTLPIFLVLFFLSFYLPHFTPGISSFAPYPPSAIVHHSALGFLLF